MKFKYKGIDKNGKTIKGVVNATSTDEAKEKLKEIVILELSPKKSYFFKRKVSKEELADFLLTLGLYLKSSIPLIKALTLTKNQIENPLIESFIDEIINNIKEGEDLYKAFTNQKVLKLPNSILEAIKIGKESGKLYIVLIEMSKFLKDEEKIKSKVSQALIYPLFIIITAIFVVSFMLTTIVPKMVNILQSLNQKLPTSTQIIIKLGDFLQHNYILIIFVSIISSLIFIISYKKIDKFKFFLHKISLKIPIIKKIILYKELGKFSYLASVLTKSGIHYLNSIKLSSSSIENEYIKYLFQKALNEVKKGKNFSTALKNVKFTLENSFIQSMALVEETGEGVEILSNLSQIYIEKNEQNINTILNMLEPILIIVIGATVGFIITALLTPMLNMNIII